MYLIFHKIFQPTDSGTEAKALRTTQILIQVIYGEGADGGLSDSQEIEGLAKEASDECLRILKEPEKSQAKPATKVLCAFMSTTGMN
jgi:DNA repair/transcription protein MET18/MMS19